MTEAAVRLDGVTKSFGAHTAVSSFDLEIPRGAILGLLGPNGSGKTTTIRMMMAILIPDRGTVELFGGSPDSARRSRVGYLPEERGVYEKMKVLEQLVFLGEIRGIDRRIVRKRAMEWLERLDLGEWATKKVQALSKGMQQKVQFIGTVLHNPDLLILDEPFSGLDPINQEVLESIVLEQQERGVTILFSTHLMEQAERLCERVCLISKSRKVLDGELKEIKRRERSNVVAVEFEGDDHWLSRLGVNEIERVGYAHHLTLNARVDSDRILAAAVAEGVSLRRFELLEPTLREIFVRHAGDTAGEPVLMAAGGAR
ncbi:MAG: ATP-binding cassette domain-containing protein [Gemmatimonadetes bacterium]|nr:ATP-binding cassette domain-containing protein [Gemmatimonadota bacterium]MYA63981.1 ATP-binding cassette domain-containing protein [Gemmatimonadota bacterium]MYB98670.1 ATP-binding cassette domain-containing protein [Gemmatimonadota bacterium]MYH53799.1 ATP-binding cassette domain-containing protein [Gemmatimonadota bacterium]MYI45762.1 ATP-binding cassette domain-containing protein [Gemmatimonadota bacterium]